MGGLKTVKEKIIFFIENTFENLMVTELEMSNPNVVFDIPLKMDHDYQ